MACFSLNRLLGRLNLLSTMSVCHLYVEIFITLVLQQCSTMPIVGQLQPLWHQVLDVTLIVLHSLQPLWDHGQWSAAYLAGFCNQDSIPTQCWNMSCKHCSSPCQFEEKDPASLMTDPASVETVPFSADQTMGLWHRHWRDCGHSDKAETLSMRQK